MVAADLAVLHLPDEHMLEARRVYDAARARVQGEPDVLDVGTELSRRAEVS